MADLVRGSIGVLMVDDDASLLEMGRLNLERFDPALRVETTSDPGAVPDLLGSGRFECLVTDYQMPTCDGISLCRMAREIASIPCIVYTGRGSEEVASAAFAAGVDDYIKKEGGLAHFDLLARRIRQAVERKRVELLYRVSIEDNRDGFAIVQGTDFVYANRAMAGMLGVGDPRELAGRSILTWIVAMESDLVRGRALNRQAGLDEPRLYQYHVRRADGELRTLEASVTLTSYLGRPASLVFNHDVTERNATERALLESEERLRRSQELAHLGSWELDLVENRLIWSDEVYRIFGLEPREFGATYEAFLEAVHPDDRAAVDAAYSGSIKKGLDTYEIEHRVVRRGSGEIRFVHEKCEHVRDGSGKVVKSVGMVHDVTEQRRLEEELRASQEEILHYVNSLEAAVSRRAGQIMEEKAKLEAFMEAAPDSFFVYDGELNLVDLNRAALALYRPGTKKEDVVGRNIVDIVPGIEKTPRYETFKEVLRTGSPRYEEVHRVLGASGDRWASTWAFKIGSNIGVIRRDITERVRVEERLRESNRYTRSLIEASLDPLVTIDVRGMITDVNQATVDVTGATREELIGSDFSTYFTDPDRARSGYQKVFAEGYVRDYPLAIRHRSGAVREVLYNASLFRDSAGEVQGVFAAARDVTERVNLERSLRQFAQIAAVSKMGATVAHDLRGPLNNILQASEIMKGDPSSSEAMLKVIEESARRSLKMISEWRASTGEIKPRNVPTDVDKLVREVVSSVGMPEGVNAVVSVGEVGEVSLDPDILRRVIDNLVRNSLEAMPGGGSLSVSTSRAEDGVLIDVKDSGRGIPEEAADKIFSPLYTTKAGGLGLGLAFCRRAVEAQGGSISFESKFGEGTTFHIRLTA